jgi:hypothetical protein
MGNVCVQDIALKYGDLYLGGYRNSVVRACEFDGWVHVRNAVVGEIGEIGYVGGSDGHPAATEFGRLRCKGDGGLRRKGGGECG